jgi:hypothetical protein
MVLLNVHPDYICFGGDQARDEFPISHYEELLAYLADKYQGQFWHALPREVGRFYKSGVHPLAASGESRLAQKPGQPWTAAVFCPPGSSIESTRL